MSIHKQALFSRIDTTAVLRGRLISSSFVYRTEPATYGEYQRICDAHFRAFPGHRPRIEGTFVEGYGPKLISWNKEDLKS